MIRIIPGRMRGSCLAVSTCFARWSRAHRLARICQRREPFLQARVVAAALIECRVMERQHQLLIVLVGVLGTLPSVMR